MGDPIDPGPRPGRLDSWKEIATYLKRDVTTVQRWERREGLPIHRQLHERQGSVYGFVDELERWSELRRVSAAVPQTEKLRWRWRLGTIASAVVLTLVSIGGVVHWRERGRPDGNRLDPVDFVIPAPASRAFGRGFALSPDGRQLAMVAQSDGERTLWVRALYSRSAVELPGTEGAIHPFWSPDGLEIGFFTDGTLKTVPAAGGTPRTICVAPGAVDAAWSVSGVIVFSRESLGLFAVPAAGGEIRPVTTLTSGESGHLAPQFLPDGRHVLFLADADAEKSHALWVVNLDDGSRDRLLEGVMSEAFFSSGHLLYVRRRAIQARPFDPARRAFTGGEFLAIDDVRGTDIEHNTAFSVATNGALAYWPGDTRTRLTWYDEAGRVTGHAGVVGEYEEPSIAPDGRRVAVASYDRATGNEDILVLEHEGEQGRRLTRIASNDSPVWSPDGRTIAFASDRTGPYTLHLTSSEGSGSEERLDVPGVDVMPVHWGNGGLVFLQRYRGAGPWDLWIKPSRGLRAVPWRQTPFNEGAASVSPDGRWIAYTSNEGGTPRQIFTQPVSADSHEPVRLSQNGGRDPRWSPDGKAVFYITPDEHLVRVPTDPKTLQPDPAGARILFRLPPIRSGHRAYDVAPDGRFLVNALFTTATPGTIAVTTRWPARAGSD
jgi:Tol biopolymer transport system component